LCTFKAGKVLTEQSKTSISSSVGGARKQSSHIHDVLMGRMQRGEIATNIRLIDTAVAEEFGVSRMPARDALMRLSHEGYLEATTRGFVIPRMSHREILETFDLRRLLEPRAAALVAQAMDDEQIEALRKTLVEARVATEAGNTELLFKASERFRNGWISAIPNSALRKAIQRYMTQVQAVRMVTFDDPGNHPLITAGNAELFEAFKNKDSVAAFDSITRFVYTGEGAFKAATKQRNNEQKSAASKA
jgi:DNA-binding GntR family transcriptional regulator